MISICAAAEQEIKKRRLTAENTLERRREKAFKKIPELTELSDQIAKTNSELVRSVVGKGGERDFSRIMSRNIQAQALLEELLLSNGFPKDWLETPYFCEKCGDSGINGTSRCACFDSVKKKISVQRLNESVNMPDNDFEHFSLSFYDNVKATNGGDCRRIMSGILEYCKAYADDFSRCSDSLLFYGSTGLGKTHLSLSVAKTVAQKGFNVAYGSLLNYLNKLEKEHFGKTESDEDTLRALTDADLLILDDLGSEFQSGFYESSIYNIVNTRLNLTLPTIISTNLTEDEMRKRYNERIISRLFGGYQTFCFVGRDIRQIKRFNADVT
jgi:DNA replication protein DnaC